MQTTAKTQKYHWRLAVEIPWLVYIVALGVLSLAERFATPEGHGADRVLDVTILLLGSFGTVAAWAASLRLAWQQFSTREPAPLRMRLLLGCFFGPSLGLVIVTAVAWDIDGGSFFIFLPVLGIILLLITLPLVIMRVRRVNRSQGVIK